MLHSAYSRPVAFRQAVDNAYGKFCDEVRKEKPHNKDAEYVGPPIAEYTANGREDHSGQH